MDSKSITLITLIVGLVLGYLVGTNRVDSRYENHMGMMSGGEMGGMMNGMMGGLQGLEGNDFDKAFLSMMIVHHEGAVAMAESALENAEHEEIKSLSRDIISSQRKEITDMKAWYKEWYGR